jgi:streptogramin lyase
MTLPIGIFTGEHGPHSMAQAKDGLLWVTNALSSTLLSFDPVSHKMKLYPLPGDALYPHTIRMGVDDTAWFTINASNQLGHFDPRTKEFTILDLPHNGLWRWLSDMLLPTIMNAASWWPEGNLPLKISHHRLFGHAVVGSAYGIDVNPVDGSIWVTQLYDHRIVRIDPRTHAMTSYTTPYNGPRRPRFDRDGILWIPAFDDGVLMRFDPRTATFENFKLPVLASDQYEVPYALAVDPETQQIWITANASDRIIRFDPKTGTFMNYPSPTRTTVIRDIAFTSDGQACNSTSNLPAYGMEDGLDSFICFDPNGGAKDKAAIAALR